jgi:hypothetical protein
MRTVVSTLLVAGLILVSGSFTMVAAGADAATPAGVDVTGPWGGTWAYQNQSLGAGTANATFQQDGQKLSGNLTMFGPGGTDYAVVGIVSGNQVKLSQPTFGTLTVKDNEMSGVLDGWDNAKITLRRQ